MKRAYLSSALEALEKELYSIMIFIYILRLNQSGSLLKSFISSIMKDAISVVLAMFSFFDRGREF